jgi:outer membrane immunogenic protein
MKKLLLATIAVATVFAAPAFAADLARPAPLYTKAPVMAPSFNWSGLYIGGEAGWQGSDIGISSPGAPLSFSANHDGFAGGGFAGVQGQFGQFVLGVEGGYTAATGSASLGTTPSVNIFFPGGVGTGSVKLRDIWSIGARVGMPFGMWMPYFTGGYGNGHFQFNANSPGFAQSASSDNGGGYAGAGIDYAFANNWIIGAEYRHYFFGSNTVTQSTVGFAAPLQADFNTHTDTVMARLSYKFNFGSMN